jgi:S-adenosyl methyltransferase
VIGECGRAVLADRAQPSAAGVRSYLTGGATHVAADRRLADRMRAAAPGLVAMLRAQQDFRRRAIRHVLVELGVRQFIDVAGGAPAPDQPGAHEVAHAIDPRSTVVYVDGDAEVADRLRAAAAGCPPDRAAVVHADATDPGALLNDPQLCTAIDLAEPVGLLMHSFLADVPDGIAQYTVSSLVAGLAPGSCLVVGHPAADVAPRTMAGAAALARASGVVCVPRTRAQVQRFFTGLDLLGPGVVAAPDWASLRIPAPREGGCPADEPDAVGAWAGIGRRRRRAPSVLDRTAAVAAPSTPTRTPTPTPTPTPTSVADPAFDSA